MLIPLVIVLVPFLTGLGFIASTHARQSAEIRRVAEHLDPGHRWG